jgi:hypothetical protein
MAGEDRPRYQSVDHDDSIEERQVAQLSASGRSANIASYSLSSRHHDRRDNSDSITTRAWALSADPQGRIVVRVCPVVHSGNAHTGRNLETELSTEPRNLVMFRRSKMPMRCAFCGRLHYWRLITNHQRGVAHGTLQASINYGGTRAGNPRGA